MNVLVLGAGAFGTALSLVLRENGHTVSVWSRSGVSRLDSLKDLPEPRLELFRQLAFSDAQRPPFEAAEVVVVATPSSAVGHIGAALAGFQGILVSASKGIDASSGWTMGRVLEEAVPGAQVGALTGPSLANELAAGLPCAMVAASRNLKIASRIQSLFHSAGLRVYTSDDMVGAELGGALKNVIAIAAGVCDGLKMGSNAKASLTTRGVAEIQRLGGACGARPETFSGLSGLGDLTLTCFAAESRNRRFGEAIGRLGSVDRARAVTEALIEGIPASQSAYQLARRLGVETPIIDATHSMIWEGTSVAEAAAALLRRDAKPEFGLD